MNQKPLSKIQTVKAKYVAPIIKNISKTLGNDLEKNRQKKILQIKKLKAENEMRLIKAEINMKNRIKEAEELKNKLKKRNSLDNFKKRSTLVLHK